MKRPVRFAIELVRQLDWMDRIDYLRAHSDGSVVIDCDEADFMAAEPSITRIEWGEPDHLGAYTPTITRAYPA